MKLLFDQNLSFKLCQRLAALYPASTHARLIGMDQVPDAELWDYARQNGFTLVTQDGDFPDMSIVRGWPPKVLWLRCGNQPTDEIERLLRARHAGIRQFLNDRNVGVLEIA